MLLPLWEQDGLRMGGLAERARLSKQTITTLVRLAARDGPVMRAPDPLDGRAIRVWLTPPAIDFAPIAADVADDIQTRATAALGDPAIQGSETGPRQPYAPVAKDTPMAPVAQSPADVIHVLSAALHDGRVEDAFALYEPDAVFVAEPGAQAITGRDSILDALQSLASLRSQLTANIRNVIVTGDVATVVNNWRLSGSAPDRTPVSMSGTSADVMRQWSDGTWGILIDDHWAMPAG